MRFVNAKDGWKISKDADALYVTHDGAKSWQEFSLKAPAQTHLATEPSYSLPEFEDSNRGFLTVTFWGPHTRSVLALFATDDGGRSWKLAKVLPWLKETSGGQVVSSAVADSMWITAAISKQALSLNTAALGGKDGVNSIHADIRSIVEPTSGQLKLVLGSDVDDLSFISRVQGWVMVSSSPCADGMDGCRQLLSTSDSGATWVNITPPEATAKKLRLTTPPGAIPSGSHGVAVKRKQAGSSVRLSRRSSPTDPDISIHLGFDKSYVATVPQMKTWWNNSPYYDTSVYLPGSANRGVDKNLNLAWVQAMQTQGWGLIPIWFGLQSACVQNAKITKFFSSDPTQAKKDGIAEADAAVTAAEALNIGAVIIYKDIENYTATSSSTCGAAVIAFLNGWTVEIHQRLGGESKAGVYGNPLPARDDFSRVQPPLDDIWISKWDKRRTIWGLGVLGNSSWSNEQRIHQYWGSGDGSYMETWGNVPLSIDPDIEDATIVGNTGAKIYTYGPYQSFDYPGAACTAAYGINNTGQIVGGDSNTGQCDFTARGGGGSGLYAFLDNNGSFSTIVPQLAYPIAQGISDNNSLSLGQIVGDTVSNGFLTPSPYSNYTSIVYPNSIGTEAYSINDDNQIVGTYWVSNDGTTAGFLDDNGVFTSITDPYGSATIAVGINGQSEVAGSTSTGFGFLWYAGSTGDLVSVNYPGQPTYLQGINSNGQMVGYYTDTNDIPHNFLYNSAEGSFGLLSDYANGYYTIMNGINDAGQIVGMYWDTQGYVHSFLAKSQVQ
jgi:hypothetical protein